MSGLDPDVQRAIDAAETELARRLTYPTGGPEQIARDYLAWLHDHDWRPIPRPQTVTATGRRDPGDYARGAEAVREEMRKAREAKTRGEQP